MPPKKRSKKDEFSTSPALTAAAVPAKPLMDEMQQPQYITLNIGGKIFTTSRATLVSERSKLAKGVENNFCDCVRDSDDNPFFDRDPDNFRHILNYLRGYELHLSPTEVSLLAQDVSFFELEDMNAAIGLSPPCKWTFGSGPGVCDDGDLFTSSPILGLCGDFVSHGKHYVTFRIEKCLTVCIGLVGEGVSLEGNSTFHRKPRCVGFMNTGDVSTFDIDTKKAEEGFKEGDVITCGLEYTPDGPAAVVFLKGKHIVFTESITNPVPMRFAAFIQGPSTVHIESVASA